VYIPNELRRQLEVADDHRCAYCRTTQDNSGQPMVVDHITPEASGGIAEFSNLCFACRRCNDYKGAQGTAQDPLTGEAVPLFHPRREPWAAHFAWDESGIYLVGLTAAGRATTITLHLNNEVVVAARRRRASVGWHPPAD
jgi:hypothetical protein